MKRLIVLALAGTLVAGAAYAVGPVRVDYNGELVTTNSTPGSVSGDVPEGWSSYGIGTIENGGSAYNTGSSSNVAGVRYEDEDNVIAGLTWTYPGTHSYKFGSAIAGQTGQAGLEQTITATAGKAYFFMGGVKYPGNGNIRFDFGIENGYVRNVGYTTSSSTGSGSNTFSGKREFTTSVVATGSALTFHTGMNVVTASTNDPGAFIDGLRVWEFDTTAGSSLVNGGFDGNTLNLTNYAAKGVDTNIRDWMAPEGWIPLGTAVGKSEGFYTSVGSGSNVGHSGKALFIDEYTGEGRKYFAQRVSMGGGTYSLSGWVEGWGTLAGSPKIGIDPTGGLDPNSASVVWSSTVSAYNVWENKTLNGILSTGGTVTVFVGTGTGAYSSSGGGGMFDDLTLSYVPEPGGILALATGFLGMLGLIRRRK